MHLTHQDPSEREFSSMNNCEDAMNEMVSDYICRNYHKQSN